MQFSHLAPLRRHVRELGASSESKKNEIAIMHYYAELCGIMRENYAELCIIMHLVVGLPSAMTAGRRELLGMGTASESASAGGRRTFPGTTGRTEQRAD